MNPADSMKQFSHMLGALDAWLQKGVAYAAERGFEVDVLATSRLAPDQYTLVQQVQAACDQAKFAAAYLSGQKAPSHPDTETTVDQLRERIGTCRAYVDSVSGYGEAESLRVAPAWMGGKSIRGDIYVHRVAVPNFYFHVTTAYAILRHNGVPLGKADFIGVADFAELGAE